MLVANNVTMSYQTGGEHTCVLRQVSLTIQPQSFVAILGASGSGKSSLLYALSGVKKPDHGEVSFCGTSYSSLSANSLAQLRRKQFGFIFQNHYLIPHLTVLENVMIAATANKRSRGKAGQLLKDLGLQENLWGRLPSQLSGGQNQRVAIARALTGDPVVIFADEPTASLDRLTGEQVVHLLQQFRQRAAVVLVTHDAQMAAKADRVLAMRDGNLSPAAEIA